MAVVVAFVIAIVIINPCNTISGAFIVIAVVVIYVYMYVDIDVDVDVDVDVDIDIDVDIDVDAVADAFPVNCFGFYIGRPNSSPLIQFKSVDVSITTTH